MRGFTVFELHGDEKILFNLFPNVLVRLLYNYVKQC